MADEIDQTNGTESQEAARPAQSRAERDSADRDAILAGWDAEMPEAPRAKDRKPVAPAPPAPKRVAADADPEPELEADDEDSDHDDADIDLDDDEEDAHDREEPARPDPDTDRRLAQVRKAEKRGKERLAREQSTFERERDTFLAEWRPKVEAYQQFERAKKSGDPIVMAEAFGYTEDDYEELSKIFHGHSKGAAADPKWKDYARKLQQDRSTRRELAELRASHEKLTSELTQERDQRDQITQRDQYIGKIEKSANDATPLLRKDLEARGAKTRESLRRLALAMAERDGETPDPRLVAKAYERKRRSGLERDKGLYDFLKTPTTTSADARGTKTTTRRTAAITVDDRTKDATTVTPPKRRTLIPTRDEFLRKMLDDKDLEAD